MIKLSYDYQGKINTIHIQINDFYAQVPYNSETQSIDWESVVYEPTRNSIKSAWDDWAENKNLSEELRDRADLALVPPKLKPDWGKFKREFLLSSAIYKIATQSTNQYAVDNFRAILTPLGYNDLAAEDYPTLQTVWGYIISGLSQQPTEEMIAELNAIALSADMDFSFDESCKIVLADS